MASQQISTILVDMLVIAHRGYSEKFPENTLRAFQEALKLNTPAIELDVHLTRDHKLVVTHDYFMGRCVSLPNTKNISDFNFSEISKADAGSFKGSEFKSETPPSLKQVLDLIRGQCLLNIEIKKETLQRESDYEVMIQELLKDTEGYNLKDVLFSSFDPYALKHLRDLSSHARIAYLDDCAFRGPKIEEAKSLGAEAYNIHLKRSSSELVNHIKKSGLKVLTYTAKNQSDLELAKALQVDGIFADNLKEALSFFSNS